MLIIKFIFINFAGQGGIQVTSKVICKDLGKVSIAISNQHKNYFQIICFMSIYLIFYQYQELGKFRAGQKRTFLQILRRVIGAIIFYISHNKLVETKSKFFYS